MHSDLSKREKLGLILAFVLLVFGFIFVVGCSNQQAVNFVEQVNERPQIVDAIIALRAADAEHPKKTELTEIELRWIFQSFYEATGMTEDEAFAEVEKKLKGE